MIMKKTIKKDCKSAKKKPNIFKRIFFKITNTGVLYELKHTHLPDKKTRRLTILQIFCFCIFIGVYLFLCDGFISYIWNLLNI